MLPRHLADEIYPHDKLKKGIMMNDGEALLRGVAERMNKLDQDSHTDIKDVLQESLAMGVPLIEGTRYELKTTTSAPKKRTTNVGNTSKSSTMLKTTVTFTMNDNILASNPYSALDEESEEGVENVYDESANLLQSKKPDESSSTFTVAAG
nr:hypothetical protein [Tanacetum cinerariifolium]